MVDRKPKIRVENLTKKFGDLIVLNSLSFDILDGEFLCVIGPTGCGKTTFCNVVSRLLPATNGSITMDGEEIDLSRHNVSFVFQEPSCIPWRTVWQDIRIGLEIKKADSAETKRKLNDIIQLVGLQGFEKFYPHQISAGMKQRVAIARAFVTEPDLLLMDEPFGQLDTNTRFQIENRLIEVWQKMKRTVIFVTHNVEEAVYLAERIVVLTTKPATIKEVVELSLPRPRNFADPKFVGIRHRVTELVKWW